MKLRSLFLKEIFVAYFSLFLLNCGVTEANNPDSEEETETNAVPGKSIFAFSLSNYKPVQGSKANLNLSEIKEGMEGSSITREVTLNSDFLILDDIKAGRYKMDLQAKGKEGQIKLQRVIEVIQLSSEEEELLYNEGELIEEQLAYENFARFECEKIRGASTSQIFQNYVTDSSTNIVNQPVQVISVYGSVDGSFGEGEANSNSCEKGAASSTNLADAKTKKFGVVEVNVDKPNTSLLLTSFESVSWKVNTIGTGSVTAIHLSSMYVSNVIDAPNNITEIVAISEANVSEFPNRNYAPEVFPITFVEHYTQPVSVTTVDPDGSLVCGVQGEEIPPFPQYEDFLIVMQDFTKSSSIKSVQTSYFGDRFYVSYFSEGIFPGPIKLEGLCYPDEQGNPAPYLPGEDFYEDGGGEEPLMGEMQGREALGYGIKYLKK